MKTAWSSGYLLTLLVWAQSASAGGLCEIEKGEPNITVNITASTEKEVTQIIMPEELPIIGDPRTEIALDFIFPPGKFGLFTLNGKHLQLLKPLMKDKDNFSPFVLQLACTVIKENKRRIIPLIMRVSDDDGERPLGERTLQEGIRFRENFRLTPIKGSVNVDLDVSFTTAMALAVSTFILGVVSTLLIYQLLELRKSRKLKQGKKKRNRRKERSSLYMGPGILSDDYGSIDDFRVQCTPKNYALGEEKISEVTFECNCEGGQRSVSSDPRTTTGVSTFKISSDSCQVEL